MKHTASEAEKKAVLDAVFTPLECSLERLVKLVVSNHKPEELALGYLRYEAIRRMSPRTFGEIHKLNLSGRIFDDLVDEALKSWKWLQ